MPRPVFADPKTDVIFKRIFGQPSHKKVLIAFLNDILALEGNHRIVDVTYLSSEQVPKLSKYKMSIVDVKCKDASGTHYIVEMQVSNTDGFEKRLMYNAAKAFVAQLKKGGKYPKLNDVISIAICNFKLWPSSKVPNMVSRWHMREEQTGLKSFGSIRHVIMELPKYTAGKHPKSHIDKWAYFFRETDRLHKVPKELSNEVYEEAFEVTRIANMSEEEYDAYEREKKAEQDERGSLTLAKREGFQEGKELGLQEGLEKGRQEGLEKGRQEGLEGGKQEGLLEGRRTFLIKLLKARFQSIPMTIRERIEHASMELLDVWGEQILSASSLRDIFDDFKK